MVFQREPVEARDLQKVSVFYMIVTIKPPYLEYGKAS